MCRTSNGIFFLFFVFFFYFCYDLTNRFAAVLSAFSFSLQTRQKLTKKKIQNSLAKNVFTIFHFKIARTNNTMFYYCIRSCNKNICSKTAKKVLDEEEEDDEEYIPRRSKSNSQQAPNGNAIA